MANVTRGSGLLENFLAGRRGRMALRLLPASLRHGSLLDLGCGRVPHFLRRCGFALRVGLEKGIDPAVAADPGLRLVEFDLQAGRPLPFADGAFAAATMLAVIEHLEPAAAGALLADVRRVLQPGGLLVLTTPARGTGRLLRAMARMKLVSAVEIDDHKAAYTPAGLRRLLLAAGFPAHALRGGRFEMGLNLWACAAKERHA